MKAREYLYNSTLAGFRSTSHRARGMRAFFRRFCCQSGPALTNHGSSSLIAIVRVLGFASPAFLPDFQNLIGRHIFQSLLDTARPLNLDFLHGAGGPQAKVQAAVA